MAALPWAAPLLAALVALVVYANSLANGFVWDDPIIMTRQLVVFRSAGDVLAPPRDIPQFSPDYYRPLTIASYLLDRAVGGGQPFVFHLSVVLAHALTSALVCVLALGLLGGTPPARIAAFAAGLLFAVHPIHTESVAWAAGRSDVLATGFLVAALVVHRQAPWSWRGSVLTGLCAAGTLGAKEIGVALYPLLVAHDVLCPADSRGHHDEDEDVPARRRILAWLRGYAGVVVVGLVYVALRRNTLGEMVGTAPDDLPARGTPREVFAALGMYLEKLLWPVGLNAYIDRIDVAPLTLLLAALFVAALLAAAVHWRRRADGVPLLALAWIAIALVPSLAILWKIPDAPLAERYLYLPSVGFCLLVGWGGAALLRRRPEATWLTVAVAAIAVVAGAVATVRRNPVWHDDIALWEDTEPKSDASGMAARGLGTAYQQAGRVVEARAAFERALTRRNAARGLQTIHNNLGTLAMYDKDYAAARHHYEAALALNPNVPDVLYNLALVLLQADGGSADAARRALPYLLRAQALNPHDADIEAGLGQLYSTLGDRSQARTHWQRALELDPSPRLAAGVRALLAEQPPP